MQKILIALDDSPIAQKVAKTGYRLAKSMEAQAILLHVIPAVPHYSSFDYSPVVGFEGYKNAAMKIGSKDLDELALNYLDKIKVILGGQNIETQVRHGDFARSILTTATELDVDVIVIGTHSRRGLEKLLVGSVAEKILRRSIIPLFVVPAKA